MSLRSRNVVTLLLALVSFVLSASSHETSYFGSLQSATDLVTMRITESVEWTCSSAGAPTIVVNGPTVKESQVLNIDYMQHSLSPPTVSAISCNGEPSWSVSTNPASVPLPFLSDPADCVTQFLLSQSWATTVLAQGKQLLSVSRACAAAGAGSYSPTLDVWLGGDAVHLVLHRDNRSSATSQQWTKVADGARFRGNASWTDSNNDTVHVAVSLNLNGPSNTFYSGLIELGNGQEYSKSVFFNPRGVGDGQESCRALGLAVDPAFRQLVFTRDAQEARRIANNASRSANYGSTSVIRELVADADGSSCLTAAWAKLFVPYGLAHSSSSSLSTSSSSLASMHGSLFLGADDSLLLIVQDTLANTTRQVILLPQKVTKSETVVSNISQLWSDTLQVGQQYCGDYAGTPELRFEVMTPPVRTSSSSSTWTVGMGAQVTSERFNARCGVDEANGPIQFRFTPMSDVASPPLWDSSNDMMDLSLPSALFDVSLINQTHQASVCFLKAMSTVGRSGWVELAFDVATNQFWVAVPIGTFPLSRCL